MEINNPTTPSEPSSPDNQPMHHSKVFKWIVAILAELIIIIGVFALGMSVGFHKAGYTYAWAVNYPSNFGSTTFRGMPPPQPGQMLDSHGVDGEILDVDGDTLTIKDEDNTEKTITISSTTPIRENSENLTVSQLKPDEDIVIIGEPNSQGQIQAKFIRIFTAQ